MVGQNQNEFYEKRVWELESKISALEKQLAQQVYSDCEQGKDLKRDEKKEVNMHVDFINYPLYNPPENNVDYQNHTDQSLNGTSAMDDINRIHRQDEISIRANNKVAFSAYLGSEMTSIGTNQGIVFDQVVLNIGNGYTPHDGVFVTPLSGVYVFYWNLMTDSSDSIDTVLYSSAGELGNLWVDRAYDYWNTAGMMIVSKLNAGIHVWVKKVNTLGQRLHAGRTIFMGFLLFEI